MKADPIIDCHVHLIGHDAGGSYISPGFRRGLVFRYLRHKLGLTGMSDRERSEAYLRKLIGQLDAAAGLDGLVLLAFDGRYDATGHLDLDATDLYIPNDYCFEVCRRDPRLLPAASINPRRRDAIDELERVAEAGAVCIKTVPNTQDFDPADPAFGPFWRRMADLGLPWLTHTGKEHTLPATVQAYSDPERLVPALEEGVMVIVAHAGTAGLSPRYETFDSFIDLLDRFPNLYGDISALGSLARAKYFPRLLKHPERFSRLLYGSDYPVPSNPLFFARRLGLRRTLRIWRTGSLLSTPLAIARALGVPDDVFTRSAQVLRIAP